MTNENAEFGEIGYRFTIKTTATIIRETFCWVVCNYDVRVELDRIKCSED